MADLGRFQLLRRVFERIPRLQPLLREVNGLITRRDPPTFTGWLMTTAHQVPWLDGWTAFKRATEEIKSFERVRHGVGDTVDALKWRHWNIAFSIHHVVSRSESSELVAAECGVGDGMSSHFASAQALAEDLGTFELHLYDAWTGMRSEVLTDREQPLTGAYSESSEERTRHNLAAYASNLRWHPGVIPATLDETAPLSLSWLHIDLNSSTATSSALEFFWPRLTDQGMIVFDDYGWALYEDTRIAVNEFFRSRPGTLLPLPTGQAFYFR